MGGLAGGLYLDICAGDPKFLVAYTMKVIRSPGHHPPDTYSGQCPQVSRPLGHPPQ